MGQASWREERLRRNCRAATTAMLMPLLAPMSSPPVAPRSEMTPTIRPALNASTAIQAAPDQSRGHSLRQEPSATWGVCAHQATRGHLCGAARPRQTMLSLVLGRVPTSVALVVALFSVSGCESSARQVGAGATASSEPLGPPPALVVPTQLPPRTQPITGRRDGLDYPRLHIGNPRTAWGSVQQGTNIIVISGTGQAYDAQGRFYSVASICSVTATSEAEHRRDLEHCYVDKSDRHVYRTTGQRGFLTLLQRDDGATFTFDMRTGSVRPTS